MPINHMSMFGTTIRLRRIALVLVACAGILRSAPAAESREVGADAGRATARSPITPDPLAGTARIAPQATGRDAAAALEAMLPPRTDSPADWQAGLEPLHFCGEPRWLPPCVPPPPCHPSRPPRPWDLVGVRGAPTCGPIYRGPCSPRTGTHDAGPLPRVHRAHDRAFDLFYRSR